MHLPGCVSPPTLLSNSSMCVPSSSCAEQYRGGQSVCQPVNIGGWPGQLWKWAAVGAMQGGYGNALWACSGVAIAFFGGFCPFHPFPISLVKLECSCGMCPPYVCMHSSDRCICGIFCRAVGVGLRRHILPPGLGTLHTSVTSLGRLPTYSLRLFLIAWGCMTCTRAWMLEIHCLKWASLACSTWICASRCRIASCSADASWPPGSCRVAPPAGGGTSGAPTTEEAVCWPPPPPVTVVANSLETGVLWFKPSACTKGVERIN